MHPPSSVVKPSAFKISAMRTWILIAILSSPLWAEESYRFPGEVHLKNIRKLTSGGQNAEAYFSPDGRYITFQATRDTFACDQIFLMDTTGKILRLVSTGKGRTTCSFFLNDHEILFASTHETMGPKCPVNPYRMEYLKKGIYAWPLFNYDLYVRDLRTNKLRKLYGSPGYDAEAEGPDPHGRIVFTSNKDGDLDLYLLEPPYTGEPKRLTHTLGYDGGSFFSPSGRYIVYRAHHPTDSADIARYKELLSRNLVAPTKMEIFIYDVEGDSSWQVTHTPDNVANFAPYFFPDEKRIIFASNLHKPGSWSFELYMVNIDGTGLERITYSEGFNAFPMFNKDGTKLVFVSNRFAKERREFNVFLADWVE